MRFRSALFFCTLVSFAGSPMKAAVVTFAVTSFGQFEVAGTPLGAAVGSLTYNQGPRFASATDGAGTLDLPNLGTFTLGSVHELAVYGADLIDFRLFVNFDLPTGVQVHLRSSWLSCKDMHDFSSSGTTRS